MPSSKEYLDFILEQLSDLEEVSWRAMMGEYLLYHRGKIFGGIFDDRFLVKPTRSVRAMMPDAAVEIPQYGTKHSLNVAVATGIVLWEAVLQLAIRDV